MKKRLLKSSLFCIYYKKQKRKKLILTMGERQIGLYSAKASTVEADALFFCSIPCDFTELKFDNLSNKQSENVLNEKRTTFG